LFACGHYERSPYRSGERDYFDHTRNKLSRGALLNQGVDVDTINLQQNNIPAHTAMLVVADPKSAYTEEEQNKIRSYIAAGGNAIFYGEPGKQPMLNPVLDSFGVHLDDGVIVAPNPHEMAHTIVAGVTDAGGNLAQEPILYLYQQKEIEQLYRYLYGSANISYRQQNGFSVKPLFVLNGADSIWMERGVFVPDSAAPVFSAQESDQRLSNYTTGIALTRMINGKEQRIVVCSDADFMSALRQSGTFLGNAFYSWVLKNEYPVYTNMSMPVDRLLTINRQQAGAIWVLFVYIIPATVLAAGILLLVRRRRK
jgi:ABC-2 type transport system permease protein